MADCGEDPPSLRVRCLWWGMDGCFEVGYSGYEVSPWN